MDRTKGRLELYVVQWWSVCLTYASGWVHSQHKSNTQTKISKATMSPENHSHSLKLFTFSTLPAVCGKRSTKFLNRTGPVSYRTTVIFQCYSPPLHVNTFACLSSCFIFASLSQQTFRGQRAIPLVPVQIISKFLRMTYFIVTEAWLAPLYLLTSHSSAVASPSPP